MELPQPTKEHKWLQRLVGEWTSEAKCNMGPDQPEQTFRGSERVRSLGELWIVADGKGEMPGGGEANMMLTLGYDTAKKRFVGSWVGSMMTNMWVYDGELDAAGTTLSLYCEGPNCAPGAPEGMMSRYRERIEMKSDDLRIFTSSMQGEDGKWQEFMRCEHRRKK